MNVDTELEVWRQQWQSGTTVPLDLRRKVERQSRFMKINLIGEILVTITIGGAIAGWAARSPDAWHRIACGWHMGLYCNRLDVRAHSQPRQLVSFRAGYCGLHRPFGATLPGQAGGCLVRSRHVLVSSRIRLGLGLSLLPRASDALIDVAVLRLDSHRHCLAVYRGVFRFPGLVPAKKTGRAGLSSWSAGTDAY